MNTTPNRSAFLRDEIMIIMTTAPTGLGHIRVTKALKDALPLNIRIEIMGLASSRIQFLHRITSTSTIGRILMEFMQTNPIAEEVLTRIYRKELRTKTRSVSNRIKELVLRRRPKPKLVVIVSTHMSLAHQIAAIKKRLGKELGVKIFLAVVVTDDSPQKLWAVYGADLITVPSIETKHGISDYIRRIDKKVPEVEVVPYPLAPVFYQNLSDDEYMNRTKQVQPSTDTPIKVLLPISGAATQLSYFKDLITRLIKKSNTRITIVSRESKHTNAFLEWAMREPHIEVIADIIDRDVVESYESILSQEIFSIEITKPSEQSFKSLLAPNKKGGVILCFSGPIGRQEYDNLRFLQKNKLIPTNEENKMIIDILNTKKEIPNEIVKKAKRWRGIILSKNPNEAAKQILALRRSGLFLEMMKYKNANIDLTLKDDGAEKFWEVVWNKVKGMV